MRKVLLVAALLVLLVFLVYFFACEQGECEEDSAKDCGSSDDDDITSNDDDDDDDDDNDDTISDEVWRDTISGLMWQKEASSEAFNWYDALAYCDTLGQKKYHDWRFPTIGELRSLIRGCATSETGGTCGVTDGCLDYSCRDDNDCSCSPNGDPGSYIGYWPEEIAGPVSHYWSSSAVENHPHPSSNYRWIVHFRYGGIGYTHTWGEDGDGEYFTVHKVRCVRTADKK